MKSTMGVANGWRVLAYKVIFLLLISAYAVIATDWPMGSIGFFLLGSLVAVIAMIGVDAIVAVKQNKTKAEDGRGVFVLKEISNEDGSRRGYEECCYFVKTNNDEHAIELVKTLVGLEGKIVGGITDTGFCVVCTAHDDPDFEIITEVFSSIEWTSIEPQEFVQSHYGNRLGEQWRWQA